MEKGNTKITLWVTNEQLARLRQVHEDIGVSISESIRRGINMYLKAIQRRERPRAPGRRKS